MSSLRKIPLSDLETTKLREEGFIESKKDGGPRRFAHLAGIVLLISYSDYGLQFAYQMTIGRLLTVEDYGIYGALASIGTLFALFSGAFPLIALRNLSRVAVDHPENIWPCLNSALRNLSKAVLPFAFLLTVGSPLLKNFYHLESTLPVLMAIAAFTLGCYLTTLLVALQALRLYIHSTALTFVFTLSRILVGVLLAYFLHASYVGLYTGLLFGNLLVIALVYGILKKKIAQPSHMNHFNFTFEGWENAIFISIGMATLIGFDTSLARHYLNPVEAGLFCSAATIAKIVLMLSAPFMNWVVPEVTRMNSRSKSSHSIAKLLLLTCGIPFLGWIAVSSVPSLILSVMVGGKYIGADALVPILAGATFCLVGVSVMNQYCFALGIRHYFYGLYAASIVGLAGVVWLLHDSATQLAYGILIGPALAVVIGLGIILLHSPKIKANI